MGLHLALVTTACYSFLATYLTPSKVCGRYEKTCDFCELVMTWGFGAHRLALEPG